MGRRSKYSTRVESMGEADKIHLIEKTSDYLKGQFKLTKRGEVERREKVNDTYFLTD